MMTKNASAVLLTLAMSAAIIVLPTEKAQAGDALKGAVIGAGVGGLMDGKDGAKKGAVAGGIAGAVIGN